jgi:hypothetical protein
MTNHGIITEEIIYLKNGNSHRKKGKTQVFTVFTV